MPEALATLLGVSIGGVLGVLWLIGMLLYGTLPIAAWIVTLNIRRIRIALERAPHAAAAAQGWTRTGPLSISPVTER